jgi:hypothetical protein
LGTQPGQGTRRHRRRAQGCGDHGVQKAAKAGREALSTPTPATATDPVKVRRRRTGRNTQLNIKARPDTITAFCVIADSNDWGLGETLEHAIALLQKANHT